jgi:predicted nucleic acid-binding protein
MLVYLDSMIVIYAIEGPQPFKTRVEARLNGLRLAGDQPVVSDLTALECRLKPIRLGRTATLAEYDRFLNATEMQQCALPRQVFERATLIRAHYNFKLGDSLHLAAAVEAGCSVFLTNDSRLNPFADLTVEVLP